MKTVFTVISLILVVVALLVIVGFIINEVQFQKWMKQRNEKLKAERKQWEED